MNNHSTDLNQSMNTDKSSITPYFFSNTLQVETKDGRHVDKPVHEALATLHDPAIRVASLLGRHPTYIIDLNTRLEQHFQERQYEKDLQQKIFEIVHESIHFTLDEKIRGYEDFPNGLGRSSYRSIGAQLNNNGDPRLRNISEKEILELELIEFQIISGILEKSGSLAEKTATMATIESIRRNIDSINLL